MGRNRYAKSELFLMEFIVVVLFFALSTSLCISAFVRANHISEDSVQLNRALTLAQTTAEMLKAQEVPAVEDNTSFYNEEFFVRVDTKVREGILTGKIRIYGKEDGNNEICTLVVKKYLPGEV